MRQCDITGKRSQSGNRVSFSQRHTKHKWRPNLQTKTILVDGKKIRLKVSTQAIRIMKKKGLLTPTGASVNMDTKKKESVAKEPVAVAAE